VSSPRLRPFCDGDKPAVAAFDRWASRIAAAGVELAEADLYVVGLLASREARLEALGRELRRERDAGRRLRVVAAERLAAGDMQKALDLAERVFGQQVAAGEEQVEVHARATGTDNVLAFESAGRSLGTVAQRIASVVAKAHRPLTRDALRRRVPASEDDFGRALKEAVAAGAVQRGGAGKKGRPFTYARGGA
jgi:hypothetical protein